MPCNSLCAQTTVQPLGSVQAQNESSLIERYTALQSIQQHSLQHQIEYCSVLSALTEYAVLQSHYQEQKYLEQFLQASLALQISHPHYYVQALRLQAVFDVNSNNYENALRHLHTALTMLEKNKSLVEIGLPSIPAQSLERTPPEQLHDTVNRLYANIVSPLAMEYSFVCSMLASALRQQEHSSLAQFYTTKAQRITHRLVALHWSQQPSLVLTRLQTHEASLLMDMCYHRKQNMSVTSQSDIPFDTLLTIAQTALRTAQASMAYCRTQNFQSPLDVQTLRIIEKESAYTQCVELFLQALIAEHTDNTPQAYTLIHTIQAIAKQEGILRIEMEALTRFLSLLIRDQDFSKAISVSTTALSETRFQNFWTYYPGSAITLHIQRAQCYGGLKNIKMALIEANIAFDLSLRNSLIESLIQATRVLSLLKEANGEHTSALEFRKIADRYQDSLRLQDVRRNKMNEELQTGYRQKFDESEALREQFITQTLQLQQQRLWLWGGLGVGALMIVGIGLLTYLYAARNRALHRVRHTAQELEAVNMRLTYSNHTLQELHKERTEFFGIVVHDLKTPLNTFKLLARTLQDMGSVMSDTDRRAVMDNMLTTTDQMHQSISKLLEINTVENRVLALQLSAVSLAPIITTIVNHLQPSAEKKRIDLQLSIPARLPAIHAHPEAVTEVLENLISNAIKFSPFDSSVIIRIQTQSPDHRPSSAMQNDTYKSTSPHSVPGTRYASVNHKAQSVRIEIEDHGPGIHPEDRVHLFQKFSRLSAQPTDGEHSSGLGLFIVRTYVEAMLGALECISTPDVQTIFAVEIPVHIEISPAKKNRLPSA